MEEDSTTESQDITQPKKRMHDLTMKDLTMEEDSTTESRDGRNVTAGMSAFINIA